MWEIFFLTLLFVTPTNERYRDVFSKNRQLRHKLRKQKNK